MSVSTICKELLDNQNVKKALEILKVLSSEKDLKAIYYLKVFHCLYKIVLKRNVEKEYYDYKDVYQLTDVCCKNLINASDVKRYDVMLRLYHIHKYLFLSEPSLSREICKFYFAFNGKFDREENLILDNLIFDYSKHIVDISPDKIIGDEWISIFIKLFRLQNSRLSRLFRSLSTILSKAKNDINLYLSLAEHFWTILIDFFDPKCTPGPTDYVDFLQFLDLSIAYSKDFLYDVKFDLITDCINRFEKCFGCRQGFAVLKKFIELFSFKSNDLASLKLILDKDYPPEDYAIFSISNYLFYKYILKSNIKSEDGIKICLSFANIMNNRQPKKPYNDFTILIQTTNSFISETNSISFNDLQTIFRLYLNDIHENLHNAIHWTCHVTWIYFKNNMHKESGDLSLMLLKFILRQNELPSNTEVLIVNTFLKYLCDSLVASGRSSTAQMALITMAVVHKNLENAAFDSYAKLKSSESSEIDLVSTAADIVNKYGAIMEKEFPPFKINPVNFDHLLFLEAKSYASVGGVQKPALVSLSKAAQKIENLTIFSSIMICLNDAITSKTHLTLLDEFEKYLTACIPSLEKDRQNSDHNLLLGSIYYQLVKCEIFKLRIKTEAEVANLSANINQNKKITRADQPDELDDTSFAPACTYLQFDVHASFFKKLDKAFFYWKSSLQNIEINEMTYLALSHIETIGYLYRLYKFKEKEFMAWKLLYEFGNKIDSLEHKTIALASILVIKSSVTDKVKAMKKYFEENELPKNSHLKHLFYLNLAKNAFLKNQVQDCLDILKEIDISLLKNKHLISIQYNILLALAEHSSEDRVAKIFVEFRKILHLFKFGKYQSFGEACNLQCVFFDTAILLGKIFSKAYNVRYARSVLKEELVVAQKLAVPLRVCDFLIQLGHTDMHCWNTSDCDFKIKIVQYVLNLKEINIEVDTIQRPSSPTLKEKLRLQPHFLSYPDCSCIYCSSIDYKMVALNVLTLSASNLLSKSTRTVNEVIKLGEKIIKHLETRTTQFLSPLDESKIDFYQVVCFANMENLEKASKYNSILLDLSKCSGHSKIFTLFLKNQIFWRQSYKMVKNAKVNKKLRVSSSFCDDKTPEKQTLPKKTPILREKFSGSNIEVTPRVKCRALLFESDDEDHEVTKSFKKLEITPKVKSTKKRMTSAQVYCDGSTPESDTSRFAVPSSTTVKKTKAAMKTPRTISKIPKTPSKTPRRKQLTFQSDDESDDCVVKVKSKTYSKTKTGTNIPIAEQRVLKTSTLTPKKTTEKTEFSTPKNQKSRNQETPLEKRMTRSTNKFRF